MSDIRYVCLSDMHFGEEDSLLTNFSEAKEGIDAAGASPVLTKMVDGLRDLIGKNENQAIKPTLILNGDILELALCSTSDASMAFLRFVELVMEEDNELFKDIVYIPGNHDHHLWELARETQYVNFIEGKGPKDELKEPWHNTKIFIEDDTKAPPSYYLNTLVKMFDHLKDDNRIAAGKEPFKVTVAYPNFGVVSEDCQRSVLFSHGHYIEPLYHLMSRLRVELLGGEMPSKIWEIEGENFAWVDFFWSAMGRSKGAGEEIERIYERMLNKEGRSQLANMLAKTIAANVGFDITDPIETRMMAPFLNTLIEKALKLEKKETGDEPLSPKAQEGLDNYMMGPLANQQRGERFIAPEVTFVFGHTHKPYVEIKDFIGYANPVAIYNTGGWIVETVERNTQHGGSIVLIDEALTTLSLDVYRESKMRSGSLVEVREAGGGLSAFGKRIRGIVDDEKMFWDGLSETIFDEIDLRAKALSRRIGAPA
ncbi:MAG: metallophosphoesterase [Proteobacteria bacterium]|nr:metallophosphoesterase [Pseudomonadota bacterium]